MTEQVNFEKYMFPPKAVAILTGVSADAQRDFRHKGLLENFGESNEGGRWKYSFRDLIAFDAADWLMSTKWHRHAACAVAWTEAPTIFGFMRGADVPAMPHRYLAVLHDYQRDGDMGLGGEVLTRCKTLAEMDSGPSFGRADLIDLKFLATRINDDLKDLAKEYSL